MMRQIRSFYSPKTSNNWHICSINVKCALSLTAGHSARFGANTYSDRPYRLIFSLLDTSSAHCRIWWRANYESKMAYSIVCRDHNYKYFRVTSSVKERNTDKDDVESETNLLYTCFFYTDLKLTMCRTVRLKTSTIKKAKKEKTMHMHVFDV